MSDDSQAFDARDFESKASGDKALNEKVFGGGINDDARIFSFLIRIWKDEPGSGNRQAVWRGHIRPVMGGEQSYFNDLSEIRGLIMAYLNGQ